MGLSVRGILRHHRNIVGNILITNSLFDQQQARPLRIRERLVDLARREYSFTVSECIFGWTAAFEQTWSTINVRIALAPDTGVNVPPLITRWETGIENTWNNRWRVGRSNEIAYPLRFNVRFTGNPHHTVRVRAGSHQSNMLLWDTADTGAVAAHEFGHMIGLVDEYQDPTCPGRTPVNTGTIMDNNSVNIPQRLVQRFADNIDSLILPIVTA